jgi:hypothetical protein
MIQKIYKLLIINMKLTLKHDLVPGRRSSIPGKREL